VGCATTQEPAPRRPDNRRDVAELATRTHVEEIAS
jgi:hypothetical protein